MARQSAGSGAPSIDCTCVDTLTDHSGSLLYYFPVSVAFHNSLEVVYNNCFVLFFQEKVKVCTLSCVLYTRSAWVSRCVFWCCGMLHFFPLPLTLRISPPPIALEISITQADLELFPYTAQHILEF